MDSKLEKPTDIGQKSNDHGLSESTIHRIQSLNTDIAQAEGVKADMLQEANEAMQAGNVEKSDRLLGIAQEADQAVSNMRMEQMELQSELEQEAQTAEATADPPQPETPPPDEHLLQSAKYIEAQESDRNVEDGKVESKFELNPPGVEGRLSQR